MAVPVPEPSREIEPELDPLGVDELARATLRELVADATAGRPSAVLERIRAVMAAGAAGETRDGIDPSDVIRRIARMLAVPPGTIPDETTARIVRRPVPHRREQWDAAVEGLMDSPSLEIDQLYQAQRYAALKRWVMDHVNVLEPGELAALIPDRLGRDSNTSRTVERLRKRHELLALPYKSGWRYPAAQIDRRGRVHPALPAVVARASRDGYEPWEIVYRLARPTEIHPPVVPGRAPEGDFREATIEQMMDAAIAGAPPQPPVTPGPSPFELLAAGELSGFERAVRRWLGPAGGASSVGSDEPASGDAGSSSGAG